MAAATVPVPLGERVEWIDALRGFALLGIIVANLRASMLQFALPDGGVGLGPWPALNVTFDAFESALIQGKFYSIFSFLFGLGFSIQMLRAAERGGDFPVFFRRRLGALLLIGILHALVWLGDILTLYALCGFVLLLFRGSSDRTLLRWACAFLLLPCAAYGALAFLPAAPATAPTLSGLQSFVRMMTSGTVLEYLAANAYALVFVRWTDLLLSFRPAKVLGMFLLGLWAGRRMLHVQLAEHRTLLRRLAVVCLPIGLAGGAALAWADHHGIYYVRGPSGAMYAVIYFLGTHVLALGYMGAFGLAWLGRGRGLLSHLAPVGCAALSNYLAQTVLIVLLLYAPGLGLSITLPVWTCLPIGVTYYALQTIASRWWLGSHRYGAAEWVWRMLTYGRRFALTSGALETETRQPAINA